MKVDVKKVDALKRELRFEVPKDRVSKTMEEIYGEVSKVAKVKGFRQGKVPRNILVSTHGKAVQEETIKKLIPEVYHEGLQKENIDPLDLPEIGDVNLKDGMLTFTATFDIRPEVKVKNYKGIKVQRKSSKVTEEDINKTLEVFKKGQGPEGKEVTVDDAFARGLGFPNLEEFKGALTRQLEMDKDRQNRADVEQQIVDVLLKDAKFIVPQSLLNKQMEYRLRDAYKHYKSHGMPDDEIKKKETELREQLKDAVERDVKVYLVFQEIAKAENIAAAQGDNIMMKVMEFLLKEADWQESK
jgi:FKBP-type peptidyl-prolyl cis-trans isomerase (trigger factor)